MSDKGVSADSKAWFDCSHCGYRREVPMSLAGKKAKCPNCKAAASIRTAPPVEEDVDLGLDDLIPDTDDRAHEQRRTPSHETGVRHIMQRESRKEYYLQGGAANLLAGVGTGIVSAFFALTFGVLMFSVGDLGSSLSYVLGMLLVGGVCVGLVMAINSGVPHMITGMDGATAAVFFLLLCRLVPSLMEAGTQHVLPTVVAAGMLTSLLVALSGFLLVRYGGPGIIRYVPIHVGGGVFAGLGVYLVVAGLLLAVGGNPLDAVPFKLSAWTALSRHWNTHNLMPVVPGLVFGLVLFGVTLRYRNNWVLGLLLLAGVMAGGLAGHYPDHQISKVLLQSGALPVELAPAAVWSHMPLGWWNDVLWSELLRQDVILAILAAVIVCGSIMRGLMLEGEDRQEYDQVRLMRSLGLGNALAAVLGGLPSGPVLGRTCGHRLSGGLGALSALVCVAVFALLLGVAHFLLPSIPLFVPVGLLLFMGFTFLRTWLFDARRRHLMRRDDHLLLIITFVLTISFGVVVGAGAGLFMATVMSIRRFSGGGVVYKTLSGASFRSNVERTAEAERAIREHGEEIFIMHLSGFLFLGGMHSLHRSIRQRLADASLPAPRYLLMDMRKVGGLGSSVSGGFRVLSSILERHDMQLVFTTVAMEMEEELLEMLRPVADRVHVFVDLDYGMEWCEDQLLASAGIQPGSSRSIVEVLSGAFPEPRYVPYLVKLMERRAFPRGRHIFYQGDQSKDMYFIESGRVNILLQLEDGRSVRLKMLRPGTIFGEMGIFKNAPRSASAVAAEDCVIYRLTGERTRLIQKKAPQLAAALQKYLISLLADRVAMANRQIRDLVR